MGYSVATKGDGSKNLSHGENNSGGKSNTKVKWGSELEERCLTRYRRVYKKGKKSEYPEQFHKLQGPVPVGRGKTRTRMSKPKTDPLQFRKSPNLGSRGGE